MQDTPPPRRRRPPPRDDGPSLPFIPIVLGVIVLGFVIGAGLSVAGRHATQNVASTQSAAPAASPPILATLAPAATPIPLATRVPSPHPASPRPARSSAPSPSPSPLASPVASPQASASAAAATPAASDAPQAAATTHSLPAAPHALVTPRKTAPPVTPAPSAAPTAAPSASAAPAAPVAASADDTNSEFGKLAAQVVRSYLAAIARGDMDGAYAQLGTSAGVASGSLPEVGIVTRATRIVHVEARGGENSVTVNVDMQTPNGAYFGQYTVHRTPGGAAIIVQHSIFKS